jgi:hypothetical protein
MKIKLTLLVAGATMALSHGTFAQSQEAVTTNIEATTTSEVKTFVISNAQPYSMEEEAAARKQIEALVIKTKANASNERIDYDAEIKRIAEMKARFNERAITKFKED